MKNYLKMTLIVAMTIPMLLFLSSCDKDDEQKEETTYRGSFKLTYNAYDDLLSVANIEISYYDENGELRSEFITKDEWKKDITYKKLPTNTGFKITYTIKEQLPSDKTVFNLRCTYKGSVNVLQGETDNIIASQIFDKGNASKGVKAQDVEKFLKSYKVNLLYQIKDKEVIVVSE
ncbi:MAG: hypothetical protein RR555_01745 [Bacteroidales bacterium]